MEKTEWSVAVQEARSLVRFPSPEQILAKLQNDDNSDDDDDSWSNSSFHLWSPPHPSSTSSGMPTSERRQGIMPTNKIHSLIVKGHAQEAIDLLKSNDGPMIAKQKDRMNGSLPIHVAVVYSQMDVLKFLLEKYPEGLRAKDKLGQLPIHLAVIHTNPACVKYILDKHPAGALHADLNGDLPVHIAARKGNVQMANVLVTYEPEVCLRYKNKQGYVPIQLCENNDKLLLLLAKSCIDILAAAPSTTTVTATAAASKSTTAITAASVARASKATIAIDNQENIAPTATATIATLDSTFEALVEENKRLQDQLTQQEEEFQQEKDAVMEAFTVKVQEIEDAFVEERFQRDQTFAFQKEQLEDEKKELEKHLSLHKKVAIQSRELEKEVIHRLLHSNECVFGDKEKVPVSLQELKAMAHVLKNRIDLIKAERDMKKPSLAQIMFQSYITHPTELTKTSLLHCIEQLNEELLGLEAGAAAASSPVGSVASEKQEIFRRASEVGSVVNEQQEIFPFASF